jgi:hypothetical protein
MVSWKTALKMFSMKPKYFDFKQGWSDDDDSDDSLQKSLHGFFKIKFY